MCEEFVMHVDDNKIYLYDKQGITIYVYGEEYIVIDSPQKAVEILLEFLFEEYSTDKIRIYIFNDKLSEYTDALKNALGDNCGGTIDPSMLVNNIFKHFNDITSDEVNEYGINYNGKNYRLEGGNIAEYPFDLLAYTIDSDIGTIIKYGFEQR